MQSVENTCREIERWAPDFSIPIYIPSVTRLDAIAYRFEIRGKHEALDSRSPHPRDDGLIRHVGADLRKVCSLWEVPVRGHRIHLGRWGVLISVVGSP